MADLTPKAPPVARCRPLRGYLLVGLCLLVVLLAWCLGAPVPVRDLWSGDPAKAEIARRIFEGLRLRRVFEGLLVGASLATSGAALQAVFANPLAEPYLLGISAGGALGATVAGAMRLDFMAGYEGQAVLAFGGALLASLIVYRLGESVDASGLRMASDRSGLLLTGVALSAFLAAIMMLIVSLCGRPDLTQQTTFWLLGGLTRASDAQNGVLLGCFAVGFGVLLGSARDVNALRLGDEEAASLGVSVGAVHCRLMGAAALMSAAAVAAAGLIGFIGLLAPHMVRLLFGSDARRVLPGAAVLGGALLVGCDALARSAVPPVELPVGIVTALLGVPLFLFLARRA